MSPTSSRSRSWARWTTPVPTSPEPRSSPPRCLPRRGAPLQERTWRALATLAQHHQRTGRLDEATRAARRALELAQGQEGHEGRAASRPESWGLMGDLALASEQADVAESAFREVLAALERAGRGRSADANLPLAQLAGIAARAGRYADAEAWSKRRLALGGAKHPLDQAHGLVDVAELQARAGKPRESMATARQAFAVAQTIPEEQHAFAGDLVRRIAELFLALGQDEAAGPFLQRAYDLLRRARGSSNPTVVALGVRLGMPD